jgi:hypothetical protein
MTRRFDLATGHRDRLQLPRQQEPREQFGVLAVALDPIARRARRLARRDHFDTDTGLDRRSVKRKPRRTRLVTRVHRLRQPLQPAHDLLTPGAEPRPAQLASEHVDRRPVR